MRFLSIILILCLFLCGCSGKKQEFFDYQDEEIEFDCTLSYDGHENGVKISMSAPNKNGEREQIKVEYTEPSIIGGYTLEKSNGEYKGKMGGVEIPFGEKTAGVIKLIEQLFSLDEEMLSEIKAADNGMTEAAFVTEEISGKIITDSDGNLSRIEAAFSNGHNISININK